MSETQTETKTKVVGFFNPQPYSIYIEISEINLKTELAPGAYIRNREGRYINDPIFEPYCHPKGLSKSLGKVELPIYYVPRFVKSERPVSAVSQATAFVQQPGGRTVPTFAPQPAVQRETAINKNTHRGMSLAEARRLGFIGKPLLVPEDYGADETSGAPQRQHLPGMKYSLESPGKIKSKGQLPPELLEADIDLSPEERAHRSQLQGSITRASKDGVENFDPRKRIPIQPMVTQPPPVLSTPVVAKPIVKSASKPVSKALKTKSAPIEVSVVVAPPAPAPAPVEVILPEPEVPDAAPTEPVSGSGIVEPLDESTMPAPNLDTPPSEPETGKRFICAADGKAFNFRSELERHVKRNFSSMIKELMAEYPA